MSISTKYNPAEVEGKIYQEWLDKGFFHSEPNPDKEPYTILIPPPNVTGVLHMGHMLNNTIQDVLIRKARMEGKEACWIPGTDHASIATEAKVVGMLREQGIKKSDLTREEFLSHAWEWKEKYGGIILNQLQRLGASCDWDRTFFTMDEKNSDAVEEVFISYFKKGFIYRDYKMVNWDPTAQTTISNEEVIYRDVDAALYHVQYAIEGTDEFVTIATTRPETILGDTAICINPNDERYTHLKGKKAIVPLVNRVIPIIEDEYVDIEFGTGCLKVTPAHDTNDYDLGQKHSLETIDILNDDGTLNEKAQFYIGETRESARKQITKELKALGCLVKTENLRHKIGFSERNPDTAIEPKLSLQWFVDMQKLVTPALENVMNDNIEFFPEKFKNTYKHWLENIKDWPISRQLWWGQQIPAYYYGKDGVAVGRTPEQALEMAKKDTGNDQMTLADLKRDEDVVDTWFSSALLPISVFDGFRNPDNEEYKYYYPTQVLVTGWDIIFFWVARMIISGYEFGKDKPFEKVYFTGMVRDLQRRKMSKSLGNSPDALGLLDQYGADGVRVGMLLSSAAGNDLLFDEKLCEQGRNFSNKIWNAFRLIKSWEVKDIPQSPTAIVAAHWFENRFNEALEEINDLFSKFRLSEALMATYKLVWDDFCSWYLEMIKPDYQQPIDQATVDQANEFIEQLMRVLHPFMPFITEEIWKNIKDRSKDDYLIVAEWPTVKAFDKADLAHTAEVFEIISNIRNVRNSAGISPKIALQLFIKSGDKNPYNNHAVVIQKLANVDTIETTNDKIENATSFIINRNEFFVPLGEHANAEDQKEEAAQEIKRLKGFIMGIDKKLSNEKFVNNAPAKVIEMERKKKADAEAKIAILEAQL
ncbi:valine--tRNA ligase [Reichenbachiella carrageenanivorans]|uniref:Valine--tRNA ligase n=1 Tax=Reichenbachiella carrageenanivorans TaxID=2979869 RepID=A0ABY6D3D5_9BACT|nr:valine--tRNA ligase [Reichenbachiella carrageenanivorans]UXX79573.1 valine--tRNA ligase [Reichenbachiella carrageenanivorans]